MSSQCDGMCVCKMCHPLPVADRLIIHDEPPYEGEYEWKAYPSKHCKEATMTTVADTLIERGNRYGEFDEHARITQLIKSCYADTPNWSTMKSSQRESLEMIAHKIGRILNGDPDYDDSWVDICGYSQLIVDELRG